MNPLFASAIGASVIPLAWSGVYLALHGWGQA